ncbi:hypothetical protein ABZV29_27620 [Streptomyces sp. NPDC005236]|uniref:hypothetical protein n=1 Tax=Streptomyces sp. NPDC005236 TaxID=3157028 RepID=UPI0033B31734
MRSDIKTEAGSLKSDGKAWQRQTAEQSYEPGMFWKMHKHGGVHPVVSQSTLPKEWRVHTFICDQMNNVGHVHLEAGELEAVFPDISRASLFRTLKTLRETGMLAPDSTTTFLAVPTEIASQGLKRRQKCSRDCHGHFWSNSLGGWVDPGDMDRTGIGNADWAAGVRERAERHKQSQN